MNTELILWRDAIQAAQTRCHVNLSAELESYLVSLLIRFTTQSDLARQVIAVEYLRAMQESQSVRRYALATVGDQCLVITGIFPDFANRRQINARYFVEIGRSAYANVAATATDIYTMLAQQFVLLMDVLQALNERHVLLPLQAYDLWQELGSQRAFDILQGYRLNK